MTNKDVAEINLWGTPIGAVIWDAEKQLGAFEYNPEFTKFPIEPSPITMPNRSCVYAFPELSRQTFRGLPGLLSDSLPDKFGNALIDSWLTSKGINKSDFNPVNRLCYIGARGMGALEFTPAEETPGQISASINVAEMVDLASQILTQKKNQNYTFKQGSDIHNMEALSDILHIGTSAGGARAKAVIAWNEKTNEVRSGQVETGEGFGYWLLKFDGVSENSDKELNDPKGFGQIEYAYYLMAKDAGIQMNPCRLFEENGRSHFMTQRFDRIDGGEKLHMQSLCALGHHDFNQAGLCGYEQAFEIIRSMCFDSMQVDLEEQFRRMIFNVVSRNQDDHTKNIAFLMDKSGAWKLSPAFDVCYSYNPEGLWTATHQMSINGKRDGFEIEDFLATAEHANLRKAKAKNIIEEVVESVLKWETFAEKAGVSDSHTTKIKKAQIPNCF